MAEIDVVPKHRSYTWLWVVLAIVIVAVLIWAFTGRPHSVSEWRQSLPMLAWNSTEIEMLFA